MIYGYTCGAMNGYSLSEANWWRKEITQYFEENSNNIRIINPTRGKSDTDRLDTGYDKSFRSEKRYIFRRDMNDVRRCDFLFVYLPISEKGISIGSLVEIGWATVLGKPIFVVTNNVSLQKHPLINGSAVWIGDSLEQGVEVVTDFYE
jgi:nucleoside 2-deoxyribosyltransferase